MKKLIYLLIIAFGLAACNNGQKQINNGDVAQAKLKGCCAKKEMKMKKYTNADFYVDGKLSAEKTLAAYREMFEYYNYPVDQWLLNHMFITDFGLGDFANVGMAGVFWVNKEKDAYFGHEIYLLPGQMIAEHRHEKTAHPAKMESWHVRHGLAYNFGVEGIQENMPEVPASQKGFITSDKYVKTERGNIASLNIAESSHFMLAGNEGCIVTEYANYHDGAGLKFTNPNVVFSDVLGNN